MILNPPPNPPASFSSLISVRFSSSKFFSSQLFYQNNCHQTDSPNKERGLWNNNFPLRPSLPIEQSKWQGFDDSYDKENDK